MRKKLLDLFRYVVSIIIIACFICFSYLILSKTFISEEIDEGESFHNLPHNTMDVIVLGSSHAQYSFSPAFFYEDTGLFSYVLGSACQPLDASYSMLKETLKTQSPKVVYLEVFTAMPLKKTCEGLSCYISAGYQMRGDEKYETLKKLPDDKYKIYANPFISSHNDWKTIEIAPKEIYNQLKDTILKLKSSKDIDTKKISSFFGFCDNYPSFPVNNSWYPYTLNEYVDVSLKEEDINSLNNIKKLCDENEIELILYKTPIDSLDQENLSYLNKVWEWANQNNTRYMDFIEESERIDFQLWIQSDSYHSYINGASLITSELSKLIDPNTIVHNENDFLEEMYSNSSMNFVVSYLNYEYDASKYLKRLLNYKGPMLISYKGDYYYSNVLDDLFQKYNVNSGMFCLIDNEQIIDSSDTCVGINYKDTNIYVDYSTIEVDGNVYDNNSDLSIIVFNKDMERYYKLDTNLDTMWKNGYTWYGE